MEVGLKIFVIFLLFCISTRGDAQCTLSNIVVSQSATGGSAQGQPEYKVTVKNTCICSQSNVKLSCAGFNRRLPVDPSVLRPDGDGELCTLNDGRPVFQGQDISFNYAWSSQFSFSPVSSSVSCS